MPNSSGRIGATRACDTFCVVNLVTSCAMSLIVGLLRMLDNLRIAIALQGFASQTWQTIVGADRNYVSDARCPCPPHQILTMPFFAAARPMKNTASKPGFCCMWIGYQIVSCYAASSSSRSDGLPKRLTSSEPPEDVHQGRHKPFDGIGNVSRDSLRAPLGRRHVLFHAPQ